MKLKLRLIDETSVNFTKVENYINKLEERIKELESCEKNGKSKTSEKSSKKV